MRIIKQFIKEGIDFFYQIWLNRVLLLTLSIRDFKQLYIRNFFGFIWALIDPLAFVVILYFVFGARYSNKDPNSFPFVVYLITGYVAFDFFTTSLSSVTNSIHSHSFLIKKVNFRVAILPLVSMMTNVMIHGIVLGISFITLFFNQIYPSFFWIQILYYIFAISILMVSIGWLTSSIYLFFPDIKNIVNIISRVMFFLTPIFWNMDGLPANNQFILKLNPLYYIVNGYRESLIFQKGFWTHPILTLYFWSICLVFLVIGVTVFKKLRPHFADVVA